MGCWLTDGCHTILCLCLFVSFSAHICSCFYMSDSLFTGLFGFTSLWFCKLLHLMSSPLAVRLSAWMWVVCVSPACCFWGCCRFVQRFGVACLVICHFVSCCDLGLFVCVFVLIIMGCSLLLSHFLFIVLILAPGSSLTSQGCLRCGNQGKLYLPGVWSHLLTFDLIKVSCSILILKWGCWREEKHIFSGYCQQFVHPDSNI